MYSSKNQRVNPSNSRFAKKNGYQNANNRSNHNANKPINISKQYQQNHLSVPIIPDEKFETDMITLHKNLNEAKSSLDKYYLLSKVDKSAFDTWLRFERTIDIYRDLRYTIKENFGVKYVTNAWLKYWEIYNWYDFPIPSKVFFNAELPGAALCAFNHFMKSKHPNVPFEWVASSYFPSGNSSALGDTYGIYESHKEKWLMNDSNDGDATSIDNIKDFAKRIGPKSEWKGVEFYSHDAGMDSSVNAEGELVFNNQEVINLKLHLGCAIAGFLTLRVGGTFIAKQYTYFEELSMDLLCIYSTLFKDFRICKPLTSRPYNSEIYLIGRGFLGISKETKSKLVNKLKDFNLEGVLTEKERIGFAGQMSGFKRFAKVIFGQQMRIIRENVSLFDAHKGDLRVLTSGLRALKSERHQSWLNSHKVSRVRDEDQL
jgi:hypothetical protein